MAEKGFAEQLRDGAKFLGAWCTFASFASAEVMTHLGLDFVVLDMQHCELTMAQFPGILGAFRGAKPVPVVRVSEVNYHAINWLFDQGVRAILAPMVNSVEIRGRRWTRRNIPRSESAASALIAQPLTVSASAITCRGQTNCLR